MRGKMPVMSSKLNLLATIFNSILLLLFTNLYPNTLQSIGIISIISYIMFLTSWFVHYKVKINYYSLFLVFSYFFFFGQFFLMLIGVPMESGRTILDELIPVQMIIKTGELILNSMILLHFGVLISSQNINIYNKKKIDTSNNIISAHYDNGLKKVSLIFFLISIIPSLIILLQNFIITLTQGYGAIFHSERYTAGGFNNILRFISLLTIPAFLMMLIAFKNSKKLKYINIILGIYLILYFMSGSRLNGVLLLSVLLLIKQFWYKPINYKESIRLLMFLLIGFAILSTISEIRNTLYISSDIVYLLKETLRNIVVRNPIFTTMEEAGYTFLATAAVVTYSPAVVPFQYGYSYINGLAMIFPNIFWEVHPAALTNTDIVFKKFLTQYGGIGSSFIAEAYWNFGYGSIFIALIFGILIGVLTKKIAKYAWSENPKMFYLTIYIAQISLLYVRSDTVSFWRNLMYYGVVPLLLAKLLSQKKKGKNNGE